MTNKTVGYATLAIVFGLGLAVGYFVADTRTDDQILIRLTLNELQDRLDTHRLCMTQGSRTGCRMDHEKYGDYHAVKRELARRAIAAQQQPEKPR